MQLVLSSQVKSFEKILKSKFNFESYESKDKPTLFWGMHGLKDLDILIAHKGIKLVYICGTDSTNAMVMRLTRESQKGKGTIFIAGSKWTQDDLARVGIPHENISLLMSPIDMWKPVPLGEDLYWYNHNRTKYGKTHYKTMSDFLKDKKVHTSDYNWKTKHSEMPELYKKCFINVRATSHDGMSQTVAEMGLMGRISIWNSYAPCAVFYETTDDIIKIINNFSDGYDYMEIAKNTRRFFVNQEKKFLELIEETCGREELNKLKI